MASRIMENPMAVSGVTAMTAPKVLAANRSVTGPRGRQAARPEAPPSRAPQKACRSQLALRCPWGPEGPVRKGTHLSQRLDKWLVYARFVKHRSDAQALVEQGGVRVNKAKVSRGSHAVKPEWTS